MSKRTPYKILPLPRLSPTLNTETPSPSLALAHKFRALRLHGLLHSPDAFASTYTVESQRGIDQTVQRLSNPKAVVFIAVGGAESNINGSEDEIVDALGQEDCEWTGMVSLLGPEEEGKEGRVSAKADPFAAMTSSSSSNTTTDSNNENENENEIGTPPATGDINVHYHLNGVYVHPSARGCGLGKQLINAAVERAWNDSSARGMGLECSVLVDSENEGALVLYKRCGFEVEGQEEYVQMPRELVGEVEGRTRVALCMGLRRAVKE